MLPNSHSIKSNLAEKWRLKIVGLIFNEILDFGKGDTILGFLVVFNGPLS